MIRCTLAACAQRVIVDAQTNKLSIIDMIEGMQSQTFPMILPSFACVFNFDRDPAVDEAKLSFEIVAHVDESEVFKYPGELNFEDKSFTRTIISFEGFVIPGPGKLGVKIMNGKEKLAETNVQVFKIELPPPQVSIKSS
jgi:hypothetical protein